MAHLSPSVDRDRRPCLQSHLLLKHAVLGLRSTSPLPPRTALALRRPRFTQLCQKSNPDLIPPLPGNSVITLRSPLPIIMYRMLISALSSSIKNILRLLKLTLNLFGIKSSTKLLIVMNFIKKRYSIS